MREVAELYPLTDRELSSPTKWVVRAQENDMTRMTLRTIAPVIMAAALVAGCQSAGTGQTVGTVGGAVAGGLVGAQFGGGSGQLVATGVGTLLGAWAGSELGSQFDQQEHYHPGTGGQQSFLNGQPQNLSGPTHLGAVPPAGQTFYQNGRECRSFSQTGQSQGVSGVACRNPDGTWQVVNSF